MVEAFFFILSSQLPQGRQGKVCFPPFDRFFKSPIRQDSELKQLPSKCSTEETLLKILFTKVLKGQGNPKGGWSTQKLPTGEPTLALGRKVQRELRREPQRWTWGCPGGNVVRDGWALLRAWATNQAGKGPPLAEPSRKLAGKEVQVMQFTGISQGTERRGKWI